MLASRAETSGPDGNVSDYGQKQRRTVRGDTAESAQSVGGGCTHGRYDLVTMGWTRAGDCREGTRNSLGAISMARWTGQQCEAQREGSGDSISRTAGQEVRQSPAAASGFGTNEGDMQMWLEEEACARLIRGLELRTQWRTRAEQDCSGMGRGCSRGQI